jgi:uncharacterized protein
MCYGAWLGRRDLRDPAVRRRVIVIAAVVFVAAEAVSRAIVGWCRARPDVLDPEVAFYLFGTESMPPLPLFVASATAFATLLIAACVGWADARPTKLAVRALAATGQLAFTWYLAHIAIIVFLVEAFDPPTNVPMRTALGAAVVSFAAACALSRWWRSRGRVGPMEWLMRRITG